MLFSLASLDYLDKRKPHCGREKENETQKREKELEMIKETLDRWTGSPSLFK